MLHESVCSVYFCVTYFDVNDFIRTVLLKVFHNHCNLIYSPDDVSHSPQQCREQLEHSTLLLEQASIFESTTTKAC